MPSRKRSGTESEDTVTAADSSKKGEQKHGQKHSGSAEDIPSSESPKIKAPKSSGSSSSSKKQSTLKSGYSTANDSAPQEKRERKKSTASTHDSDDQDDDDRKPLVSILAFNHPDVYLLLKYSQLSFPFFLHIELFIVKIIKYNLQFPPFFLTYLLI